MDDRKCSGKPRDLCESFELSKVQILPGNVPYSYEERTKRKLAAPYVGGRQRTRGLLRDARRGHVAAARRPRHARPSGALSTPHRGSLSRRARERERERERARVSPQEAAEARARGERPSSGGVSHAGIRRTPRTTWSGCSPSPDIAASRIRVADSPLSRETSASALFSSLEERLCVFVSFESRVSNGSVSDACVEVAVESQVAQHDRPVALLLPNYVGASVQLDLGFSLVFESG